MKKIIIFTSDGAGGHTATTNALSSVFKDRYEVQPVNIFKDIIGQLDAIKIFTLGRLNGEQFYERCMAKKKFFFLNKLHTLGKTYFRVCQPRSSRLVEKFLAKEGADLVISVVPLLDGAIINACQKLEIPFLLVPTDLDSTNYIHDIKSVSYKKFHVALPFEDERIRSLLEPAHIPTQQVCVTGFPIRADFFETKDFAQIKQDYQIPEGKPVILLLMGSVGSDTLYTFSQELAHIKEPAHIIICVGRHSIIKEKIRTINFPKHITITLVDFVQRISDLMAVADLCITKAGPVSMSEAMYMNLPMLVDITSSVLDWEKLNYQFIQKHQFGEVIRNVSDLKHQVNTLLSDPQQLKTLRRNLQGFEKKHGCNQVLELVQQMI